MAAIAAAGCVSAPVPKDACVRFGVVTDLHYADRNTLDHGASPAGIVEFRTSPAKLARAVDAFNAAHLDFAIELGDLKDFTRSRAETLPYLDEIESIFARFEGPRYHVCGNHDFDCLTKEIFFAHTPNDGQIPTRGYYSFEKGGITFVVLDGCFNLKGEDYAADEKGRQNWTWFESYVPPAELDWLDQTLAAAQGPAVVFCHQRLDPEAAGIGTKDFDHAVKNAAAVRVLLEKSGKVKSVITGHEHRGGFCERNGIAYHSLPALVGPKGPYAVIDVLADGSVRIARTDN